MGAADLFEDMGHDIMGIRRGGGVGKSIGGGPPSPGKFPLKTKIFFYYMWVARQGRSQDLGGGGARNIFFRCGDLHGEAMRFVRGVRGHAPPRKFFKMVQFGAFWCIFGSDFVFKKFQKLPFFI